MSAGLVTYTVYDHPSDFPHSFVVRRFTILPGSYQPDPLPYAVGPTLDAVRSVLPPGLVCITRSPEDEGQIVEVWL